MRARSVALLSAAAFVVGCADAPVAPTPAPVASTPVEPPLFWFVSNEFPPNSPDTIWLKVGGVIDANNQSEFRSTSLRPDGSQYYARSLYASRRDLAPLNPNPPHENTRESINLEVYQRGILGYLDRLASQQFYSWWGHEANDTVWFKDVDGKQMWYRIFWTPVYYQVFSHRVESRSGKNAVFWGDTLLVAARAFAPDDSTEIYNRGTASGWSTSNTTISSMRSAAGTYEPDPNVYNLYEPRAVLLTTAAGRTTVTTTFDGATVSGVFDILPRVAVTGSTKVGMGMTGSWTASATGGSPVSYRWDESDDNGSTWYYVGDGPTFSRLTESCGSFFVRATATINGVSSYAQKGVVGPVC